MTPDFLPKEKAQSDNGLELSSLSKRLELGQEGQGLSHFSRLTPESTHTKWALESHSPLFLFLIPDGIVPPKTVKRFFALYPLGGLS